MASKSGTDEGLIHCTQLTNAYRNISRCIFARKMYLIYMRKSIKYKYFQGF